MPHNIRIMFSLIKLFGRDDIFFDLLDASAEDARASILSLCKILRHPETAPALESLGDLRRSEKKNAKAITEKLCKTTVTSLEREDIQALSSALYKIPKTVDKFAERYVMTVKVLKDPDFSRHAYHMEQAAEHLVTMVKALRKTPHIEEIKDLNGRLQQVEGDADKLMLELLQELYSGRVEGMQVLVLKDLYELLERIIDRCRDAGNVVTHIVLKSS